MHPAGIKFGLSHGLLQLEGACVDQRVDPALRPCPGRGRERQPGQLRAGDAVRLNLPTGKAKTRLGRRPAGLRFRSFENCDFAGGMKARRVRPESSTLSVRVPARHPPIG